MLTKEQALEVGLIENEDGWPHWPILPMKKAGGRETGVLWGRLLDCEKGDPFDFYPNANMWMPSSTWGTPVKKTAEELIQEGWVGD